jgi:SAM-dependent methyltransferase
MPDALFAHPRLAALYDPLDPVRDDLVAYLDLVAELGAESILDVGCGTGTFACLLAARGKDVHAIDPAGASIDVARRKPHADTVHWIVVDGHALPPLQVDAITMTGNVAQVFLTDAEWISTLTAAHHALRPGGTLIFETRDPDREAWRAWTREQSYRRVAIPGSGVVENWVDLYEVRLPFVSFRTTFVFESDGTVMTADSTLRFRSRTEIVDSLHRAGFVVNEVRDAPDRPGLEMVFLAGFAS